MYRLDEEPARETAAALVPDSETEELPHLLQPMDDWPSDQGTANSSSDGMTPDDNVQWNPDAPQLLFAQPHPVPLSPASTAASTLDPDSPVFVPSYLDNLRPLPSGPEEDAAHLERLFRGLEEQQRAIEENSSSNSEASSSSNPLDTPPSISIEDATVHDADPPFMTDGRGRVVWSRRSSSLSRVRASSSSATILPHSKSTIDLTTPQEGFDGPLQQTGRGRQLFSTPRQLVRRRSVPLVGPNADAEFVTDGRGRAVFASSDR